MQRTSSQKDYLHKGLWDFSCKVVVGFGGIVVRKRLERVRVGFGDRGSVSSSTDCLLLSQ